MGSTAASGLAGVASMPRCHRLHTALGAASLHEITDFSATDDAGERIIYNRATAALD
jgi:hypothetical protein